MDSNKLRNISEEIKGRVNDSAEHFVSQVKNGTQVAANAVDSVKKPAHILYNAGSKLNDLSHDYFGRLLNDQRKIVDGVVEDDRCLRKSGLITSENGMWSPYWASQCEAFFCKADGIRPFRKAVRPV